MIKTHIGYGHHLMKLIFLCDVMITWRMWIKALLVSLQQFLNPSSITPEQINQGSLRKPKKLSQMIKICFEAWLPTTLMVQFVRLHSSNQLITLIRLFSECWQGKKGDETFCKEGEGRMAVILSTGPAQMVEKQGKKNNSLCCFCFQEKMNEGNKQLVLTTITRLKDYTQVIITLSGFFVGRETQCIYRLAPRHNIQRWHTGKYSMFCLTLNILHHLFYAHVASLHKGSIIVVSTSYIIGVTDQHYTLQWTCDLICGIVASFPHQSLRGTADNVQGTSLCKVYPTVLLWLIVHLNFLWSFSVSNTCCFGDCSRIVTELLVLNIYGYKYSSWM
ncbi:hypothetical protein VP01_3168g2 [Puccinia sorghi]|uniref:Uncharacterized protein n=1 Tax=Puccinia sorghi TaxID=27349 RepID=A0A0L6UYQ9_9BASI|nr:hypothetical protein VP01_3168g2 [Puccinia sorghi]